MIRRFLLTAFALAAITCAYAWPLPALAASAVAHDRGDPLLVTWILWWTSHAVPLTDAWWNAPAFYPSRGVFAFSENLLGLAPLTAPIIALTGSPLLAYNAAFLLSYVFCGLGAYLLGFVVTRSHAASFVAAVAFAFAPYRLSHTQHLQLLSSYWMPVAVAALHLYLESPRWRWAALFAGAWLLQALACGYYLFYLTLFVFLWLAWFGPGRLSFRRAGRLSAAWFVAACLLLPLLLGYRSIHHAYGFRRSPVELINYSADVAGLLAASPDSLLWHRLHGPAGAESELFPGVTIFLLLLGGVLVRRAVSNDRSRVRRSAPTFYVLSAVVMWLLSLGPAPKLSGVPLGVPGPYALLATLPGFDGMRVPARFWMVSVLCLAVAAAHVISRIESRRARRLAVLCATLGVLLDGWPRSFPVVAAPSSRITTIDARARLGLPLHESETETMYGAIAQARPVFNGYSGYTAPQHAALRDLLDHRDPRILARLAAKEPIEVIVERSGDPDGAWAAFVERQPTARRVDVERDWASYEIRATGAVAPSPATGPSLHVARIDSTANAPDIGAVLDDDLDTRWHTQPQSGGETISLELDGPQHVSAVVLCLGTYAGQYPRGLSIEVSPDGVTWSPAYTGGTALETYDAALRLPREVPVSLPVNREAVRFLRLRQTGSDPRVGWTIVELRVIG